MEYKRYTKKIVDDGTVQISYADRIVGCYHRDEMIRERLCELEDKIEQGTMKEEKTCKNISEMHPVDGFTCRECGITLIDYVEERVDEEYNATHYEYEIKYCPNCGAKVVQNG